MRSTPNSSSAEWFERGDNMSKRKRGILIAALVIFCVIFCVSGGITAYQTARYAREDSEFGDLKKHLGPKVEAVADTPEDDGAVSDDLPPEVYVEEKPKIGGISTDGRYDELYAQNPDLYGWITIEGTKIDYPVMYTPADPEYYLHRSFEKKKTASGTPFIDGACYEGCGNLLIYGHHMNNGSMFGALLDYAEESFWETHPTVVFDTVKEHGEYSIIAAFRSKVYKSADESDFIWYNYTDLNDKVAFDEFIAGIESVRLYDTGLTAEYGDQLITLSTCANNSRNRFVVVAKRVK